MNLNKWDGAVPDWELEPVKEDSQEVPPSAEAPVVEIIKEVKEIPPENLKQNTEKVNQIRAEIAGMVNPEQKPNLVKAGTKIEQGDNQERDIAIKNYLGENFVQNLTKTQTKIEIGVQSDSTIKDINSRTFKTVALPAALGVLSGVGSWIAAASGVTLGGATIAGVPLLTAAAVGLAPLGVGVAAIGSMVWVAQRFNNWRKREKAYKAAEAF